MVYHIQLIPGVSCESLIEIILENALPDLVSNVEEPGVPIDGTLLAIIRVVRISQILVSGRYI